MTVAELRKALEGLPDDMLIVITQCSSPYIHLANEAIEIASTFRIAENHYRNPEELGCTDGVDKPCFVIS